MRKFTTLLTAAAGTIIILTAAALLSCGEASKDVGPLGTGKQYNENNPFYFQGYLNDRITGHVIVGAKMDLWAGELHLGTTYTNQNGWYKFELGPEWNMTDFTVVASKEGYGDAVTPYRYYTEPVPWRWHDKDMMPAEPGGSGNGGNHPENPIYYVFVGYVNDHNTGQPIPHVKLTWEDLNTHEILGTTDTNSEGRYMSWWLGKARNKHWIRVTAEKAGYLTKVLDHKYYIEPTPYREWEFDLDPLGR